MTYSPTRQFIKDQVANGAAPALATVQTLREVVWAELEEALEAAAAAGDNQRASAIRDEMLSFF